MIQRRIIGEMKGFVFGFCLFGGFLKILQGVEYEFEESFLRPRGSRFYTCFAVISFRVSNPQTEIRKIENLRSKSDLSINEAIVS